jgi:hypothetical protein
MFLIRASNYLIYKKFTVDFEFLSFLILIVGEWPAAIGFFRHRN